MRQILFFIFALTFAGAGPSFAEKGRVDSVNYEVPDILTFGITDSSKYHAFLLDNPSRVVIDVEGAETAQALKQPPSNHPLFSRLRIAAKSDGNLRIVVELKQEITRKTHKLRTKIKDNKKLTVALLDKKQIAQAGKTEQNNSSEKSDAIIDGRVDENIIKTAAPKIKPNGKKKFTVAIDAGHGGDDPGAHGPNGTDEKQVTLAIAKKLEALINAQAGMKAKLVRKGDYYVGLRERMKIARKAKADLFISIHADAVDNPDVRGASVYTLSPNGASSEAARWLANSENAKEKVGGVNLDDKEDMLASVLLDLSQTATQQASTTLAEKVLENFRTVGGLHYDEVQKAGFVVLKSPDIPSILVETAYISNPSDELNLLSPRYQNKMAAAIFKGILNYYMQLNPGDSNRMAKL